MEISSAANLARLWSEWEVRVLVLTSLFIQILLISIVGIKNRASKKMCFLIWLCFLLADWVATFALGVLAKNLVIKKYEDDDELKVLWAPFLLLHLGGPDNITAFSLEDNELWLRHLVGLLFQVGTAFYIFFSSFVNHQREYKLSVVTILMFMGGIIKYVERTLALKNASRDNFRKSMVTDPDPGPDYPEGVKEYRRKEIPKSKPYMPISSPPSSHYVGYMDEIELIRNACYFFEKLKRLIVELVLTQEEALISWSLFRRLSWEGAYKMIEIELGFLYEVLYTKAVVVRSLKGWIFRFTSVSSIIAASIIFFAFIDHDDDEIDVTITFILLSGAIVLEFWSFTRLIFADWTLVWMREKKINPLLTSFVLRGLSYTRRSRWPKHSMAQYNLISFCLKDIQQPRSLLFGWGNKIMNLINVKDQFDNYWYRSYKNISGELKEFIFEDIKGKVANLSEDESYNNFKPGRGKLALKKINNSDEELDNSISKVEFDESILLWHIATDICYYLDKDIEEQHLDARVLSNQEISRDLSNYMLYILVSRPFMLSAGIGQIRFGDTCAEAKRFFIGSSEKEACKSLYEEDTEIQPKLVKGDKSQSVLFSAVRVAKSLLKQETNLKKRWEFISLVWLEMLCYAAFKCRGHYHAQRLAFGGELLTLVSCLMGHLGIGHQYRIFVGEKGWREMRQVELELRQVELELWQVEQELQGVERELYGVERELQGLERELQWVEPELQWMEKNLQQVERELQGVERKLQGVERKLQGRQLQLREQRWPLREQRWPLREQRWQLREQWWQLQEQWWQLRKQQWQLREQRVEWELQGVEQELQWVERDPQEVEQELQEVERDLQGRQLQLREQQRQLRLREKQRQLKLREQRQQLQEQQRQLQKQRQLQERRHQLQEQQHQLQQRWETLLQRQETLLQMQRRLQWLQPKLRQPPSPS